MWVLRSRISIRGIRMNCRHGPTALNLLCQYIFCPSFLFLSLSLSLCVCVSLVFWKIIVVKILALMKNNTHCVCEWNGKNHSILKYSECYTAYASRYVILFNSTHTFILTITHTYKEKGRQRWIYIYKVYAHFTTHKYIFVLDTLQLTHLISNLCLKCC